MNIEHEIDLNKILPIINDAVYASEERYLKDIEEKVLIGSLQNKTYGEIAKEIGYSEEYISRDVGFNLWKILTKALGESANKKNIQGVSRRAVKNSSFNNIDNN